jgi:hypothetical protein
MFTINRYAENRIIVGTIKNDPIPFPTLEVVMAVDRAIHEDHVCLLLDHKCEMVTTTATIYAKTMINSNSAYSWLRVYGIIVGSIDKAEKVIVELEKLKMWLILKQ